MDGKRLVEAAKLAQEKGPELCEKCPFKECCVAELKPSAACVSACELADAILAAYEWGRVEAIEQVANVLVSLGLEKLRDCELDPKEEECTSM